MGELRLSELTMIDKEIFDMARKIENMGIYLSLVSQLDKLARHNRQGEYQRQASDSVCPLDAGKRQIPQYHQNGPGGDSVLP